MIYIEAPKKAYYGTPLVSIFLAGGITNCPDWQTRMVALLKDTDLVVYNPRRKDFPIGDPKAALEQITWEKEFLDKVDMILFWFAKGSLNPIVLFEYGKWLMNLRNNEAYKPIFVGIDPEYARRQDVEIQTMLENGVIYGHITYSLEDLANRIKSDL